VVEDVVVKKFAFAISSPDEFILLVCHEIRPVTSSVVLISALKSM